MKNQRLNWNIKVGIYPYILIIKFVVVQEGTEL